jgi:hypothetical protein
VARLLQFEGGDEASGTGADDGDLGVGHLTK